MLADFNHEHLHLNVVCVVTACPALSLSILSSLGDLLAEDSCKSECQSDFECMY